MLHFKHKQPETLDNRATTNSRRNIALQSIDGEGSWDGIMQHCLRENDREQMHTQTTI